MARLLRSSLQGALKMMNSTLTMVGLAMVVYSLWNLFHPLSTADSLDKSRPLESAIGSCGRLLGAVGFSNNIHLYQGHSQSWFLYTMLAMGIFLCMITFSGHIAAESDSGHCLSCYMFSVCFLLILEVGFAAEIIFNKNWEEDFPDDPTGQFNQFKMFIRENFYLFKWVGLAIFSLQVVCVTTAFLLWLLGPDREQDSDSDDDPTPSTIYLRRPLILNPIYEGLPQFQPRLQRRDEQNLRGKHTLV
eukprot:TRINITY_DN12780_c0_g1_i1.p1 TRINITY_DN12780_c0_g1~~TRINITY_DN12780_c0_g1_i1.p1  ORF type:complete len:246 (+),score=19.84 TRINITY_DN12780_c0_g1_i1:399-1136(+)